AALDAHAVVLSAPTGTGKSTQVPRWCAASGRVLVVEPRRVACRTLAARVAELEGSRLGDRVGYVVRDEHVASASTGIVFATPGIVLRDPSWLESVSTLVIDELHERSLEIDLLLALVLGRERARRETPGVSSDATSRGALRLVLMSATVDAAQVAASIGGAHLAAEVRAFTVDVRHVGPNDALPSVQDLPARVVGALATSERDAGDVLVFLPGKAEIAACAAALRERRDVVVVPLHGGLSLDEQRRAFDARDRRKVILATNVAETSLTIPGVGVVIDAGLVRQTRYHDGRGSLALVPIAEDSAGQRAGRAGRTMPGVCYRLWGRAARLAPRTLPEIHRESLVPLVMTAAAWGVRAEELPFLDAPKGHALASARTDLEAWGALDADGALTEAGRGLFALPVDAPHARLLVEARRTGCLDDAIDLVAALAIGRPMFVPGAPPDCPEDDLRHGGCDATALIRAVRIGRADLHRVSSFVVDEARRNRARLRRAMGLDEREPTDHAVDRERLARTALAADPRSVHVARKRGRDVAFGNGGTELDLARESAVRNARDVEALVVLDTRAFGTGKDTRLLVTCATPIPLAWIARAGLGRDRLASVDVVSRRAVAEIERVYAGRVVATREEVPTGELARDAIAELFLRGSILKGALATARDRFARSALAAKIANPPTRRVETASSSGREASADDTADALPPTFEAWVRRRLETLGVESGDDLALLSAGDLLPDELGAEVRDRIDRDFPIRVDVGDASYEAEYDLVARQVVLRMVRGNRRDPPPLAYLPRFEGLRVCVSSGRGMTVLRERG
ncbi:MAG: ATP-dependent RNA helicase, partial [Deltaproteobacteria bacterium]|nr:ATP-dependent RNA helicase [Deltaproteobacteria bacterium]